MMVFELVYGSKNLKIISINPKKLHPPSLEKKKKNLYIKKIIFIIEILQKKKKKNLQKKTTDYDQGRIYARDIVRRVYVVPFCYKMCQK
jgi:hypothetical protein